MDPLSSVGKGLAELAQVGGPMIVVFAITLVLLIIASFIYEATHKN